MFSGLVSAYRAAELAAPEAQAPPMPTADFHALPARTFLTAG